MTTPEEVHLLPKDAKDNGVEVIWQDFYVTIPPRRAPLPCLRGQNKKSIIEPVSGKIPAGSLTAILGPSGCGKSTFLNFISGRHQQLKGLDYNGACWYNDASLDDHSHAKAIQTVVGYVMQDDVLFETMTVRECFEFVAKLSISNDEKVYSDKVDETLKKLEISAAENTVIGGHSQRGVSGGERKRVCIGVEMLKNPKVMFMDEPTTGLDSFTAEKLIAMCLGFSNEGMTIACTIHQPSSQIFKMFERVILMAERTIIYQGPIGTSTGEDQTCDVIIPFFEEQGYPFDVFCNPAEYLTIPQ